MTPQIVVTLVQGLKVANYILKHSHHTPFLAV